jgi:hypothetical protein
LISISMTIKAKETNLCCHDKWVILVMVVYTYFLLQHKSIIHMFPQWLSNRVDEQTWSVEHML